MPEICGIAIKITNTNILPTIMYLLIMLISKMKGKIGRCKKEYLKRKTILFPVSFLNKMKAIKRSDVFFEDIE